MGKNKISFSSYFSLLGELIKAAWFTFSADIKLFMIIALIFIVPINIVLSLFFPILEPIGDSAGLFIALRLLKGLFVIFTFMTVAYTVREKMRLPELKKWIYVKFITISKEKILTKAMPLATYEISLSSISKKIFPRLGDVIITGLMLFVFLVGLTTLLIIPGIIYSVYWTFTTLVVLFKDKSGKAALDYSKSLVKGRWWKVLGCIMLVSLLVGIPSVFLQLFVTSYLQQMLSNFFLNLVLTTVIDFISTLGIVAFVVLYLTLESTTKN